MEKDFRRLLGGVTYDAKGNVVSAQATIVRWIGKMNASQVQTFLHFAAYVITAKIRKRKLLKLGQKKVFPQDFESLI